MVTFYVRNVFDSKKFRDYALIGPEIKYGTEFNVGVEPDGNVTGIEIDRSFLNTQSPVPLYTIYKNISPRFDTLQELYYRDDYYANHFYSDNDWLNGFGLTVSNFDEFKYGLCNLFMSLFDSNTYGTHNNKINMLLFYFYYGTTSPLAPNPFYAFPAFYLGNDPQADETIETILY